MEEMLPDETSIYAAEGTVFHDVVADVLEWGLDPQDFIGHVRERDGFTFTVTQDMVDHMLSGVDRVRELAAAPDTLLFIETKVDISPWTEPGTIGTTDVGLIDIPNREITIKDWKYGYNPVGVVRNPQPILYGLGFWNTVAWKYLHTADDVKVRIIIEQPRVPGAGGTWETTLEELFAIGEEIKAAAARTLEPDAPHVPGEKQCHYCKAAKFLTCKAYVEWSMSIVQAKFEDLDQTDIELQLEPVLPPVSVLLPEEKTWIVANKAAFEKFLDNVHAATLHDALAGDYTPGWKAVTGKNGNRKWTNEDSAQALLVAKLGPEKAFERKLLTPAQAEKRLSKADRAMIGALVSQEPGKPILVPATDERPALKPYTDRFEDLDASTQPELI